jgi:hypothetical protein
MVTGISMAPLRPSQTFTALVTYLDDPSVTYTFMFQMGDTCPKGYEMRVHVLFCKPNIPGPTRYWSGVHPSF